MSDEITKQLFNRIKNTPVLSLDEERELFFRLKQGDKFAKDQLVEHNLRLVLSLVKKYSRGQPSHVFEDLFQAGCIALTKATLNYDLSQEIKFSTFATYSIEGEIRKQLDFQRDSFKASGEDKEEVRKMGVMISLDRETEEGGTLLDNLAAKQEEISGLSLLTKKEQEEILLEAREQLTEQERTVLAMMYDPKENKSTRQIGHVLGVSEDMVKMLGKSAVEKLQKLKDRYHLEASDLEPILHILMKTKETADSSDISKEELKAKENVVQRRPNDQAQYIAERRTIQVLEILKYETDEKHSISQAELLKRMQEKDATTVNAATLSKTVDEIITQLNPDCFEGNEDRFKILYRDYEKENLVKKKKEIQEKKAKEKKVKEELKRTGKLDRYVKADIEKSPSITDLRFVHDFNYEELDQLMDSVNSNSRLSIEDKKNLMKKLQSTASKYYSSPFYNKEKEEVSFYNHAIYNRFDVRKQEEQSENRKAYFERLIRNLSIIQEAINKNVRICYYFNSYTAKKEMLQKSKYKNSVSPYYVLTYQDHYYLIGAWEHKETASHLRIDLLSDVEIMLDEEGNPVKNYPLYKANEEMGIPKKEEWNPEKYAMEHLHMFYDKPEKIQIRICKSDYNILYSWFGEYFTKKSEEGDFDIVEINTSPRSMVYFALQYADSVEVMTPKIREMIANKVQEKLVKKYC